jgi:hypothetical protein
MQCDDEFRRITWDPLSILFLDTRDDSSSRLPLSWNASSQTGSGPCEDLVSRCRGEPLGDSRRGPAANTLSSTLRGYVERKQHVCRLVLVIAVLASRPKKKLVQQMEARADINLRQGESAPFEDQPRVRRS